MSVAVKWTAGRVQEQAARVGASASPLAAEVVRHAEIAVLWAELEALRLTVKQQEQELDDLSGGHAGLPDDLGPPLDLDSIYDPDAEAGCALDSALDPDQYEPPPLDLEAEIVEALGRGPLGFLSLAGALYPDFERDYPDEEVFYDYLESMLYSMGDSYFFDGFHGRGGDTSIMLADIPDSVTSLNDQRHNRQYMGVNPATGNAVYQSLPMTPDELTWREMLKARLRNDARRAGKKIPRSWERYAPTAKIRRLKPAAELARFRRVARRPLDR